MHVHKTDTENIPYTHQDKKNKLIINSAVYTSTNLISPVWNELHF